MEVQLYFVCQRGTVFQLKVYERGTLLSKMVYIRDGGVGPRGRASLYKTLLSLAPPPSLG